MDDEENWVHDGVSVQIGDLVEVGDNFMVPAAEENDDGVEYYILQCRRMRLVCELGAVSGERGKRERGAGIVVRNPKIEFLYQK
jgi:hypothetical protein